MKAELTRVLPKAEMLMTQHSGLGKEYRACMNLGYCQDTSKTRQPSLEDSGMGGMLSGMT